MGPGRATGALTGGPGVLATTGIALGAGIEWRLVAIAAARVLEPLALGARSQRVRRGAIRGLASGGDEAGGRGRKATRTERRLDPIAVHERRLLYVLGDEVVPVRHG